MASLVEYLVVALAVMLAVKADRYGCCSHVRVAERDFWQPFGKIRVDEQRMERGVRIHSQQALQEAKQG